LAAVSKMRPFGACIMIELLFRMPAGMLASEYRLR
jgi:hypothetical protein